MSITAKQATEIANRVQEKKEQQRNIDLNSPERIARRPEKLKEILEQIKLLAEEGRFVFEFSGLDYEMDSVEAFQWLYSEMVVLGFNCRWPGTIPFAICISW
jgi:hypothetical protein